MRLLLAVRNLVAARLARASADLYAARAIRARHLHALSGGRLVRCSEGWEVRAGLRTARWSPVAGCYVLRQPGRSPAYERSPIRVALWIRALPRTRLVAAGPPGIR